MLEDPERAPLFIDATAEYLCIDMCVDMRIDMRMDMCIDMCVDMCIDMCTDICCATALLKRPLRLRCVERVKTTTKPPSIHMR